MDAADRMPGALLMDNFDRITVNPEILGGQPCIRGLRLTVRRVLKAISACGDRETLRAEYPELDDEDIRQALEFAAANLDDRTIELRSAP